MKALFNFFKNILFMNDSTAMSIGLSQFKVAEVPVPQVEKSIRNKDIKLSDLMRRN